MLAHSLQEFCEVAKVTYSVCTETPGLRALFSQDMLGNVNNRQTQCKTSDGGHVIRIVKYFISFFFGM